MSPLLWIVCSAICAIGAGTLVYFVMKSQLEVRLSGQREELATARALLAAQQENLDKTIDATKEVTRREALDNFLGEIRIEERHYVREQKMLFMTRKSMIRQERLYFRNLPLTNWIEQEMPFEEGADANKLLESMAMFDAALLKQREEQSKKVEASRIEEPFRVRIHRLIG